MKALEKFVQRRYWLFVDEWGTLSLGIDNLVYSTNKIKKAHEYIKQSKYTHTTVLDTFTGECYVYKNGSFLKHDLSKVIQRNQREFQKLKTFSELKDKPPWD